jgi:hypothetical protein
MYKVGVNPSGLLAEHLVLRKEEEAELQARAAVCFVLSCPFFFFVLVSDVCECGVVVVVVRRARPSARRQRLSAQRPATQ